MKGEALERRWRANLAGEGRFGVARKRFTKELVRVAKHAMLRTGVTPLPFRVSLVLTDRCGFRCPTCSKWTVPADPARELSTAQWKAAIDKVAGHVFSGRVTFSGGEPLLRDDVLELVEYAARRGLAASLITNGACLDREMAQHLKEAGLANLIVSLNGMQPETHDTSRGAPGSHAHIMQILPVLQELDLRTTIETIVLSTNIDELVPLARMVESLGLYGILYQVLADVRVHRPLVEMLQKGSGSHLSPGGDAWRVPPKWYEDAEYWVWDGNRMARLFGELQHLQRMGVPILNRASHLKLMQRYYESPADISRVPCLAPVSNLYVDPYGGVRLCYGYPPVGDIRTAGLGRIWRGPEARAQRRAMQQCRQMCRVLNNNV